MSARVPRERCPAVQIERLRAMAPVISATALDGWFADLPLDALLPAHHRLVTRSDGIQTGTARMHWHSSTMTRYTTTASVIYTPVGEQPTVVTVRGRQLVNISEQEPNITRRATPRDRRLIDLDHLGNERFPLVWRYDDGVTADLIVLGARLKEVHDPAVARVQSATPLSILDAERALLAFGGVLLNAAGRGEQGLLFE